MRWPYEPRLYAPPASPSDPGHTFKQVWFAGAHSDVGGGYAESGLANASLHWMVREADAVGLLVDLDKLDSRYAANAFDCLHDETLRTPLWTIAGAFTRRYPPQDFRIHESVEQRRANAALAYRPPLPRGFIIEATRILLRDSSGREVERPVPGSNKVGAISRTEFSAGFWIALLLLSALSTGLFLLGGSEAATLAKAQLTSGWSGDLPSAIREVGIRHSLGQLLTIDFLAIAVYAALIAYVMRAVLAFSDPDGYPRERLGVWLSLSGGYLPVADALENILTLVAVGSGANASTLPFAVTGMIAGSVLASLFALVKFVLLAAFACGCVVGLLAGVFRRVAPGHAPSG